MLEVMSLSLLVDLGQGLGMLSAGPALFQGGVFALVCYLVLAGAELERIARAWEYAAPPVTTRGALLRMLVHALLFLGFGAWTTELTHPFREAPPRHWEIGIWILLACGVVGSAVLVTNHPRLLVRIVRRTWRRLVASLLLGGVLAACGGRFNELWLKGHEPAMRIIQGLLAWNPGDPIYLHAASGDPVIGTRQLVLQVTPACSEYHALLAFWLLGGVFAWVNRRALRPFRFLAGIAIGSILMYTINAVRIYGLIQVGLCRQPDDAVALAHSRVSQIAFLVLAALWLVVIYRPRRSVRGLPAGAPRAGREPGA
jgi:exosortase/archaeosortase family protein